MLKAYRDGEIDIFDALEAAPELAKKKKHLDDMRRYSTLVQAINNAEK